MNNKYNALKNTTDWIVNSSSEEFMSAFNNLGDDYSGMTVGDFIDAFIDDCHNNYYEYDILTTENFIFGAEELTAEKDQELSYSLKEKAQIGNIEFIDISDIKLTDSNEQCTDLYNAANDEIYYSLAA